jgi:cytosine/adenosine deaminase-related metal-dependent hydrolase
MKRFASQLIFTNSGTPLRKGIITVSDDGTITDITDTRGELKEESTVEFFNGIIIPGFVNCHCHLELSHLKGAIPRHTGLGEFLVLLQDIREFDHEEIIASATAAGNDLYREGTQLCADICNNSLTFNIKKENSIRFINLLEVFGTNPSAAGSRMNEILNLHCESGSSGFESWIVPHTPYAVSLPLFRLIKKHTSGNRVTSIHFMESEGEESFLSDHTGLLIDSFRKAGMLDYDLETPASVISAILDEVTPSGNLILVHNTFATKQIVNEVSGRKNIFWCLCPNANLYIENRIPPAEMLLSEGCEIVVGTDSLASNDSLSILSELKTLQYYFPSFKLEDLIRWATVNGARALGKEGSYGKIEPGKKPGLLLLENLDLINLKLLPETSVKRLI